MLHSSNTFYPFLYIVNLPMIDYLWDSWTYSFKWQIYVNNEVSPISKSYGNIAGKIMPLLKCYSHYKGVYCPQLQYFIDNNYECHGVVVEGIASKRDSKMFFKDHLICTLINLQLAYWGSIAWQSKID